MSLFIVCLRFTARDSAVLFSLSALFHSHNFNLPVQMLEAPRLDPSFLPFLGRTHSSALPSSLLSFFSGISTTVLEIRVIFVF